MKYDKLRPNHHCSDNNGDACIMYIDKEGLQLNAECWKYFDFILKYCKTILKYSSSQVPQLSAYSEFDSVSHECTRDCTLYLFVLFLNNIFQCLLL